MPMNKVPSRISRNDVRNNLVALLSRLENVPGIGRNSFERCFEAFWIILLLESNSGDICDLANED
jgi:hypothetical protein